MTNIVFHFRCSLEGSSRQTDEKCEMLKEFSLSNYNDLDSLDVCIRVTHLWFLYNNVVLNPNVSNTVNWK